jgi:hypothetical protein
VATRGAWNKYFISYIFCEISGSASFFKTELQFYSRSVLIQRPWNEFHCDEMLVWHRDSGTSVSCAAWRSSPSPANQLDGGRGFVRNAADHKKRFPRTSGFHFQGRKDMPSAFHFYPEDWARWFLRNVGTFLLDYGTSYLCTYLPRQNPRSHKHKLFV